MSGRLMGLDVGRRTVGIAVSDPLGVTAQGVEVWRRKGLRADLDHLAELAADYDVKRFVLGLPIRTDGTTGPEAKEVSRFAEALAERTRLPVSFWDERFTTKEAERGLISAGVRRAKRRTVVDMTAAVLILQGFMDREAHRRE